MSDFIFLQNRLDEIISSDKFIQTMNDEVFTIESLAFLNIKDYFLTLHNCKNLEPIYINDNQRDYYGFESNLFKDIGYVYYFSTVHPSKITSLVDALVHVKTGKKGYLNLDFRLKNHEGNYEYFIGSTKSFFINNKPAYALSILQKANDSFSKNTKDLSGFSKITSREREILTFYISGMQSKEIADRLSLSEHTVKTHIKSIYKKFGVNNIRELLALTEFLKIDT